MKNMSTPVLTTLTVFVVALVLVLAFALITIAPPPEAGAYRVGMSVKDIGLLSGPHVYFAKRADEGAKHRNFTLVLPRDERKLEGFTGELSTFHYGSVRTSNIELKLVGGKVVQVRTTDKWDP